MANARRKKIAKRRSAVNEPDSSYILKVVLYLILGAFWVRFIPQDRVQIPLPIGAFIGLYFASHDRFVIDRKFEYLVLIVAMFVGFWLPIGLSINI